MKRVRKEVIEYIEKNIFPSYEKNDKGHDINHIKYVIDRSLKFADMAKEEIDYDMVYVIAAYHDIAHYIDAKHHEELGAKMLLEDENLKQFFTDKQIKTMSEAVYDHRSSLEGEPRTIYGKIVSSADRNTNIDIVFIRSFFVAHERTPKMNIEEYLDYTIDRLSKRYSEENPENMFYEDETYKIFLKEMREILKKPEEFKNRYCEINNIKDRNHTVEEEPGYNEE